MSTNKQPTSFRLSSGCLDLIGQLADSLGISQAAVVEQAVRKLARAELVSPAPEASADKPATKKRGKTK